METMNDTPSISAFTASCPICFGTGVWGAEPYPCHCRDEVTPAQVRKVLMMLSVPQMTFLRTFEHTHAYQLVTDNEWPSNMQFWVEDDDAVFDGYDIIIPATKIWFASGMCGGGGYSREWMHWIKYNPLGLALRQCLMAGADAACR